MSNWASRREKNQELIGLSFQIDRLISVFHTNQGKKEVHATSVSFHFSLRNPGR